MEKMLDRRLLVSAIAAAVLAAPIAAVEACQIPVFRYALERWEPSPYEAVILHGGELTKDQQKLVERLRQAALDEKAPVNLETRTLEIDKLKEKDRKFFFGAGELPAKESDSESSDAAAASAKSSPETRPAANPKQLPWIVLLFPFDVQTTRVAWSGPLTDENVTRIIDSPTRRKVVKQLLAGTSAVWLLIESGDKQKDDAAAELLTRQLKSNQENLQLPEMEEIVTDEFFQEDTSVELKLEFALLRISRDDPAESIFVSTLINSEEDLHTYEEPIAMPIFGRGRSFFSLVGDGINKDNLQQDCQFLIGPCSCRVKAENPGADLLFAVNWWDSITGSVIKEKPLPELSGIAGLIDAADKAKDEAKSADQPPAQQSETNPSESTQNASTQDEQKKEPAQPLTDPAKNVPDDAKLLAAHDVQPAAGADSPTAADTMPMWIPVIAVVGFGLLVIVIGTILMKPAGRS